MTSSGDAPLYTQALQTALPRPFAAVTDRQEPRVRAHQPDPAERAAIEACLGGDRSAFDGLVERHQRQVFAVCYRYLSNREDAADLTQEVFIRAYRSLSRFRGDSAFSTWLHRIAVNACLSFKTSANQRRKTEEIEDDVVDTTTPTAEEKLDAQLRGAALREALATLPEKQRLTVILKVIEDRTHAEVAEMLGTTVGTVKANLFYAIQNLRKRVRGAVGAIQ